MTVDPNGWTGTIRIGDVEYTLASPVTFGETQVPVLITSWGSLAGAVTLAVDTKTYKRFYEDMLRELTWPRERRTARATLKRKHAARARTGRR